MLLFVFFTCHLQPGNALDWWKAGGFIETGDGHWPTCDLWEVPYLDTYSGVMCHSYFSAVCTWSARLWVCNCNWRSHLASFSLHPYSKEPSYDSSLPNSDCTRTAAGQWILSKQAGYSTVHCRVLAKFQCVVLEVYKAKWSVEKQWTTNPYSTTDLEKQGRGHSASIPLIQLTIWDLWVINPLLLSWHYQLPCPHPTHTLQLDHQVDHQPDSVNLEYVWLVLSLPASMGPHPNFVEWGHIARTLVAYVHKVHY